jgi:hypothetical protein
MSVASGMALFFVAQASLARQRDFLTSADNLVGLHRVRPLSFSQQ